MVHSKDNNEVGVAQKINSLKISFNFPDNDGAVLVNDLKCFQKFAKEFKNNNLMKCTTD